MEEPVQSLLRISTNPCHGFIHFDFGQHQTGNCELWCSHQNTLCILSIRIFIPMPREEGSHVVAPPGTPLLLIRRDSSGWSVRCLWPRLNSHARKNWSEHLPWRMWRRSSRRSQFRLLRSIFFSLYPITGSHQAASWGKPPWPPLWSNKDAAHGKLNWKSFPLAT
jgi:hypothetical protein